MNKTIQRECNVAFQETGPAVFKRMMMMQAAAKDDKRDEVKDKAPGVGTNEDEAAQDPQEKPKTRSQKKAAEDKGEEERDQESVLGSVDAADANDAEDEAEEPVIGFGSFGESDDEGDVLNLSSMIMQLAAQPTTITKASKKEKNLAKAIIVHTNETLRVLLEVCSNSGNVNLKKAEKSYHSTPTTEMMRCSTKYEATLGVSPGPRVLWQRIKQCLNGNKSAAELSNHERTKLDNLGIVHTGSPNEDLSTFSTKFNEQVKVVAATGSALSGEEQVSKFSIALQKAAAATSVYMKAYRFTLEAMRDGEDADSVAGNVKTQPPTLEYLQVKAREKVEINVDTKAASGSTKGSSGGGGSGGNHARQKGKGRGGHARCEVDEVSFFNNSSNSQQATAQSSGKGKSNGKGKGKGKGHYASFGKGKGKGYDGASGGGGYNSYGYGSRNGDYNGNYSGGGGGHHWQYSGKGNYNADRYHQSGQAATASKPVVKQIMPQKVMFTEADVAMDNKMREVCEAAKNDIAAAVSKHLEKLVFGADEQAAYASNKKRCQRQDPRRAEESDDESDSSPFGWGS